MDANGTHYHLLLGEGDWGACLDARGDTLASDWRASPITANDSGLDWRAAQHELTLQSRVYQFASSPFEKKPRLEQRRGADRDVYGNWYWIAESGQEIRVQSSGTGRSGHFWAAGDGVCEPAPRYGDFEAKALPAPIGPLPLSGLAVTEDHYLVAGVLKPKGLLIFDLHATGAPRRVVWPEAVPFEPFDMVRRPGGGVWILDRAQRCYWGLDRKLNVIRLDHAAETQTAAEFQPIDPVTTRRSATRPFPEAIMLAAASPVNALDPIAIEALPDGTVLILDYAPRAKFSRLLRYRWADELGEASLDAVCEVVDLEAQAEFRLTGYDLAFVPARQSQDPLYLGQAFVAASDGNQTYAFDVFGDDTRLQLKAQSAYYPMRLFGGKAIVTAGDTVYYDFAESWLPLIEQKRPRYDLEATLSTFALDGKQPDCVWHRLLIDACIPPDSAVQVWSRAANEPDQLERAAWWPEPKLHRRADGSELPFVPQPSAADAGTWELLFQRAAGRYLQLKLTLSGNGRSTPRLRALRAYYPRFSYLEHYLPAVYRDDPGSASFLERFLANPEGTFTALEDKIANVQLLFDVRSAPADALAWLANWLGVVLDPAWDERRRRMFIRYAMEFFQYRGTIRGLLMALHLALDSCLDESIFTQPLSFGSRSAAKHTLTAFRIIEQFRTRQTPPVVLGDPTEATGLRVVVTSQRWDPNQGRDSLIERWHAATGSTDFPIRDPGKQSATWQTFARSVLAFVPASNVVNDLDAWQTFLRKRYGTIGALNTAYNLPASRQYTSFTQLALPVVLPDDGGPLWDWYEFEGTLLPMQRAAHQFLVLLPAPATFTEAQRQERVDIAERVINLEKPAHTKFTVKFYWAMFRLGEARLGEDTLVDLGSRAPDLMPPFVLGRDYLSEGYLAPGHPQDVKDRLVLDRDRLTQSSANTHHI